MHLKTMFDAVIIIHKHNSGILKTLEKWVKASMTAPGNNADITF